MGVERERDGEPLGGYHPGPIAFPVEYANRWARTGRYLGMSCRFLSWPQGLAMSFNAVNTDPQLAYGSHRHCCPLWEPGRGLGSPRPQLRTPAPLLNPSHLAQNASVMLREMTEGAIGELSRLFADGVVEAIRSGHERIDKKLLASLE
jgi:hypothetical protein